MRLFIAAELPGILREELAGLKDSYPNIKGSWVLPENMHITLLFIAEGDPKSIIESLKTIKHRKIEACASRIGYIKDRRGPRILWVNVDPEKEIKELAEKVSKALNIPHEKEFKSHITLCRIKEAANPLNLRKPPRNSFLIDHITLFSSTLTPEGPIYEALYDFPLS